MANRNQRQLPPFSMGGSDDAIISRTTHLESSQKPPLSQAIIMPEGTSGISSSILSTSDLLSLMGNNAQQTQSMLQDSIGNSRMYLGVTMNQRSPLVDMMLPARPSVASLVRTDGALLAHRNLSTAHAELAYDRFGVVNPILSAHLMNSASYVPSTSLFQQNNTLRPCLEEQIRHRLLDPYVGLFQHDALTLSESLLYAGDRRLQQEQSTPDRELPRSHRMSRAHAPAHNDQGAKVDDAQKQVPKRGIIEPFPEKLHRLLMEVEAAGKGDVISFSPDGRAFQIHKPDEFFHNIVPIYFKQSRLSSFKRQLNLYGFELITAGESRGGYFHESFIKDRPEEARVIRRRDIQFNSRPKSSRFESRAPDFYSMPPITSSEEARVVAAKKSPSDEKDTESS